MNRIATACGCGLLAATLAGCSEAPGADPSARQALSANVLDLELCAPDGDFAPGSSNPYFPIQVGQQSILEGEEDGAPFVLQITVLDETERVAGVLTRVVEEREWEDDELLEISRNFFAQARDGTVCYFGEEVDIFEEGGVSHAGAWRADEPGNQPGIMMPAEPQVGMRFATESAPGIAEDEFKIIGVGPVEVPAADFEDAIRVRESNPLDAGKGYKVFAAGAGLVIDEALELVSY